MTKRAVKLNDLCGTMRMQMCMCSFALLSDGTLRKMKRCMI